MYIGANRQVIIKNDLDLYAGNLVSPGESVRVHSNSLASLFIEHSMLIHQHEGRNTLNTECIAQLLTTISILEGNCLPGHGGKILVKADLVLIAAHKYNLEFLSSGNSIEIGFAKKGSKSTARRAPVSTNVYK